MKEVNHMGITHVDVEKYGKIQHPLMLKTHSTMNKRKLLYPVKNIYKNTKKRN